MTDTYVLDQGIFRPRARVAHRDAHYDPAGFQILRDMQERHFWYRGRHRFLRHALEAVLRRQGWQTEHCRIIDLGGGCGGWLKYLLNRGLRAAEIALGDSSLRALEYAADILPPRVTRYQVDLLQLGWQDRWDVAFLLDVLEHIPEDEQALRQIHAALAPDGLLFVTTPALQSFWTWNDDAVRHVRRYSKVDFRRLAAACRFELLDSRYFMFLLSPLLLASRWLTRPDLRKTTPKEMRHLLARTHRVPNPLVNELLRAVFAAETPVGHRVPFPWGTSVLAVLRKPTAE